MGALGPHRLAQQWGPSWYPCQSLYFVMSPSSNWCRIHHCPQGAHAVYKQHLIGIRNGVWIIGSCHPPPGGSVSGPSLKQNTFSFWIWERREFWFCEKNYISGLKNNRTPVCQKHTDRECQRTAKAPYDLGHIFHAWIDSFEAIGNDTKTLIATTSILPTVTAIISDTIISYIHDIYNVWYMIYGRVRRIRSFFFENLGSFVDVYDTVCNNKKLYFKFKCWWRQNKMFKSFNINRLIGAC